MQKPPSQHEKSEGAKAFLEGAKALKKNDLREAEKQFERATQLDPGNNDYRAALIIAREHLLTQLVQDASKARVAGHDDTARSLLAEAYLIDPKNPIVQQHIDDLAHDAESQDAVLFPAAEEAGAPVALASQGRQQSSHIRSAATDVIRQVLTAYGISPTQDTSVRNQIIRFDADDVDYAEATTLVQADYRHIFRPAR